MSKFHWLEITEYVSVVSSVCGTVAAAVTQQAVYAAAPITLTLGLNLLNRQRADQLTRDFAEMAGSRVEEAVREEIAIAGDRVERLESKNQQFRSSAKQKIAELKKSSRESKEAAIALVHQLIDPIGDRLEELDLEVREQGIEIEQSKVFASSQEAREQIIRELDPYSERLAKLESVAEQLDARYGSEAFAEINEQLGRTLNTFSERIAELEQTVRELPGADELAGVKEAAMQTVREATLTYSSRLEKLEIKLGRYATRIEEIRALVEAGATKNQEAEELDALRAGEDPSTLPSTPILPDIYDRRIRELESYIASYVTESKEQLVLFKEALERGQAESSLRAQSAPKAAGRDPEKSTYIPSPAEIDKTRITEPKQFFKEKSSPDTEASLGSSLPPPVPSEYRKETITPIEEVAPQMRDLEETPSPRASRQEPSDNSLKSNRDRFGNEIESRVGEAVYEIQGFVGNLFKGRTRLYGEVLGEVKGWRVVRTIDGHADAVICVSPGPDGQLLASCDRDNAVKIWQIDTGAEILSLRGEEWFASANSIAWSPDGGVIAGALGENITIWNSSNGEELHTQDQGASIYAIAFIDGQTLASGSQLGAIKIWQPFTGSERLLCQSSSGITTIAISPNGQILASGSEDATTSLWSFDTLSEIRTQAGHYSGICSVAISPDGRILASSSSDKTIKLWSLDTGEEILTLQGHLGAVKSLAFSPDSNIIASGSADKTIRLWDTATGQEISILKQHSGEVNSVAFSKQGKTLISGGDDKKIKIWRRD